MEKLAIREETKIKCNNNYYLPEKSIQKLWDIVKEKHNNQVWLKSSGLKSNLKEIL